MNDFATGAAPEANTANTGARTVAAMASGPSLTAAVARRDVGDWPTVSVIMPVRNESNHLITAVNAILSQDYPGRFDVCLAVAPSDDDTEQLIAELVAHSPRVRVVANPKIIIPAGLNAAVAATSGDVIVRVDGHATLCPGYITQAVETMMSTGAVNVGGRQIPVGDRPLERAAAGASASRIGSGGAQYRSGAEAGPTDTVYLGVYDRVAMATVGWYDERLEVNEDYELNIRIRDAGGVVFFDPQLRVDYQPRGTWTGIATQYFRYGRWKAQVVRMHPGSMRARQALPAALPWVLVGAVLFGGRWGRFVPLGYSTALIVGNRASNRLLGAAVMAVQQLAWGAGFAYGAVRSRRLVPIAPLPT